MKRAALAGSIGEVVAALVSRSVSVGYGVGWTVSGIGSVSASECANGFGIFSWCECAIRYGY